MGTKVRILTDSTIDGVFYRANQIVEFPAGVAKAQESAGAVDAHKDAVAYCHVALGAACVEHKPKAENTTEAGDAPA